MFVYCRQCINGLRREENDRIREAVYDHFGGRCNACDTTSEPFEIDHVNGDGAKHRQEVFGNPRGSGGTAWYRWLHSRDFDAGGYELQLLCAPCHRAKTLDEQPHWNARKTHCKHGHPFDEENTYISPRGNRGCRACRRNSVRKHQRTRRLS